jgi:hypothetical protein
MWLGKLLSIGEVVERAPVEEPALRRPEPAQPVARNDEQGEILAVAPADR